MVDDKLMEQIYQESLEEKLIMNISQELNLSLPQAMDLYYNSRLANKIHCGKYGIQYLDYHVLTDYLLKYEQDLIEKYHSEEV